MKGYIKSILMKKKKTNHLNGLPNSESNIIRIAVDDHVLGEQRRDIDLINSAEDLDYLRMKAVLTRLQSEARAQKHFEMLKSQCRSDDSESSRVFENLASFRKKDRDQKRSN